MPFAGVTIKGGIVHLAYHAAMPPNEWYPGTIRFFVEFLAVTTLPNGGYLFIW
jgi:hypothetical protein